MLIGRAARRLSQTRALQSLASITGWRGGQGTRGEATAATLLAPDAEGATEESPHLLQVFAAGAYDELQHIGALTFDDGADHGAQVPVDAAVRSAHGVAVAERALKDA